MIEKIVTDSIFETLREKLVSEGYLPDVKLIPNFDSTDPDLAEAAADLWLDRMHQVRIAKGFCIELLGYSSPQYKSDKKTCRIVIDVHQFLPGDIGNDTSAYYEPLETGGFERKKSSALLSDLTFAVYAVGASSIHMQTMNHIIMQALPYKGYMKPSTEIDFLPFNNFLVLLQDKGRNAEMATGEMERYFIYKIPDLQEIPDTVMEGTTSTIQEITLLTRIEGEPEPEE